MKRHGQKKSLGESRIVVALFISLLLLTHPENHLSLSQNCPVLSLLNVAPLRTFGEVDGVWDRGLDVIPAGHLAVEQINDRSDILPGHELKLIDIDSEACGLDVVTEGIVNVFKELVDLNGTSCIVGVVGMLCSQTTKAISPIVSHPQIGGYIQIVASTSPIHRARDSKLVNLFHIIGASSVFNEATVAMMEAFNWTRISIVHDSIGFFSESVATDFVLEIQSLPKVRLILRIPISSSSFPKISETFDTLSGHDGRISYWSVTYKQSALLLCESFHRNIRWPSYVYIIRERTLRNILNAETSCTEKEILWALEGALLLQYRLYTENSTPLFSGCTFGEYKAKYVQKLHEFASKTELNETDYANILYDQVWAFALAINNSLQNLNFEGHDKINILPATSDILRTELKRISFQGTTGKINFGESQENPSYVDIFQVQNGTSELIGIYDPFKHVVNFTNKAPQNRNKVIPNDMFETYYELLPLWLVGCIIVAQGMLFCITTANLFFIIMWRKEKEIKATSPFLNMLTMTGTYILCAEPILLVVLFRTYNVMVHDMRYITSFCVAKNFTTVGLELVLSTLLFRMLRIRHIFRIGQMTTMSNYWMDKYLFVYIITVCAGKIILLILQHSIDPNPPKINQQYVQESSNLKLPYYVGTLQCTRDLSSVWLVVVMLYSGVLLLLVLTLAIMTRHIKNHLFKDTKKVNVMVFLIVLILAITVPLQRVFTELGNQTRAVVAEWFGYFSVPLLCQICLFIPKTLPPLMRKSKEAPLHARKC